MSKIKSSEVPSKILTLAIRKQIDLARKYKLSYGEIVGVLEFVKAEFTAGAHNTPEEVEI